MSIPSKLTNAGRKRANQFDAAEARTSLVKQISQKENAAFDARTSKLKALRLAKEEADRIEAAQHPPAPLRKKKTVKPR